MKKRVLKSIGVFFCTLCFLSSCSLINQNFEETDVTLDVSSIVSAVRARQMQNVVVNSSDSESSKDDTFYIVVKVNPLTRKHYEKTICVKYSNVHDMVDPPEGYESTFFATYNNPKINIKQIPYGRAEIKIYLYIPGDWNSTITFDENKTQLLVEPWGETAPNGIKLYQPYQYYASITKLITSSTKSMPLTLTDNHRHITDYMGSRIDKFEFPYSAIGDDSTLYIPEYNGFKVYYFSKGEAQSESFPCNTEISGKRFLDLYFSMPQDAVSSVEFNGDEE